MWKLVGSLFGIALNRRLGMVEWAKQRAFPQNRHAHQAFGTALESIRPINTFNMAFVGLNTSINWPWRPCGGASGVLKGVYAHVYRSTHVDDEAAARFSAMLLLLPTDRPPPPPHTHLLRQRANSMYTCDDLNQHTHATHRRSKRASSGSSASRLVGYALAFASHGAAARARQAAPARFRRRFGRSAHQ